MIDVGTVRLWGSFTANGGQISSTGIVTLGSALDNTPRYIAAGAQWSSSGPIQANDLSFANGAPLISGPLTIDRTSGTVTRDPSSAVQITRLGATNLPIAASLSIDVRQPAVQVSGPVSLNLPENASTSVSVGYQLDSSGAITGASAGTLVLTFAGGTLNAQVAPTKEGLLASAPKLSLSGISSPIALPDLLIDGAGPAGIRLSGATSMPNIDMGNGALALQNLNASSLSVTSNAYQLDLGGSLLVANAPGGQQIVQVNNLRIAQGSISGTFGLPDVTLGSAGVLRLSGLSASLKRTDTIYTVIGTGNVELWGLKSGRLTPDASAEASAALTFTISDGRTTGDVAGPLNFTVSQVQFKAENLKLADDLLTTSKAHLTLQFGSNIIQAPIYGLRLGGGEGLAFQNTQVQLPDFAVGQVAVRKARLERQRTADGRLVFGGTASFGFARFVVDGTYRISAGPNDDAALMSATLSWDGLPPTESIPLGVGSFSVTHVGGNLDLDTSTAAVTLDMRAAARIPSQTAPLLQINGPVQLILDSAKPIGEPAQTAASLLGKPVSNAQVRLSDRLLTLRGQVPVQLQQADLDLTFGTDGPGSTSIAGTITTDVTIPQGFLFGEPIDGQLIRLPAQDKLIPGVKLQVGLFQKGDKQVWAARGLVQALDTYAVYVSIDLSKSEWEVELSKDLTPLQTVTSSSTLPGVAGPVYPTEGNGIARKRPKSAKGVSRKKPKSKSGGFAPSTTATNNVPIVTDHHGVQLRMTPVYTDSAQNIVVYSLDITQSVSLDIMRSYWRFRPVADTTMVVQVEQAPALEEMNICVKEQNGCIDAPLGQPLKVSPSQQLSVSWKATTPKLGLLVKVYAVDSKERRFWINTRSTASTELTDQKLWYPALPNGTYTVTALLASDPYAPFEVPIGQIEVFKQGPPKSLPADSVRADPQRDRSVVLSWSESVMEPDVAGLEITVNGLRFDVPIDQIPFQPSQAPQGLRRWFGGIESTSQQTRTYTISGLEPGKEAIISIAPYDMNGTRAEAVTKTAKVFAFVIAEAWPPQGTLLPAVDEVRVRLSKPGAVQITLRDATNTPITGTTRLIQVTDTTPSATIGAVFEPAQALPPGTYRVEITAAEDGAANAESFSMSWNITVAQRLYLPVMSR